MEIEAPPATVVSRRRIIKRPRLTRILDESSARIILLVAPAGYGKTTLAHEWLDSKRSAWYRASPASTDVAALAVGLAKTAAELVPGAGDRMTQRLRTSEQPEEDAEILAEMLAEDLRDWPADARLVIDDCQFVLERGATDEFVRRLVHDTSVPLLLASRTRPRWATRLRIYGDVFEVDRTLLAMDGHEAAELLANRTDAIELASQAAGWPAVLGLAALTASEVADTQAPTTLYDFFAEELLQSLSATAREGLFRLSLLPSITESTANALLGQRRSIQVLSETVTQGLLQPVERLFDLHPLLRNFLQDRLEHTIAGDLEELVSAVGDLLLAQNNWDDALQLAEQFRRAEFLERFVEAAWEQLLDEGRLTTLYRLVNLATELRVRSPLLDLVDAELAFRHGDYRKAEVLADEATRNLDNEHLLVRAYVRAGQSAHLEGREEDGMANHRRALSVASAKPDERQALWGLFVCSMELESTEAVKVLDQLEHLGTSHASDAVRLAGGRMLYAIKSGAGIDPTVFSAVHRLPRVDDPLVRSSFLHIWSVLLTYCGRYTEALEVADQQLAEIRRNRHDFVLPHALLARAGALRGLRRFDEALLDVRKANPRQRAFDRFGVLAESIRIGTHLAAGDLEAATSIQAPRTHAARYPSAVAELIAIQALALACSGRFAEAEAAIGESRALSSGAEPKALCDLAQAVNSDVTEDPTSLAQAATCFVATQASGNVDAFVIAYRGYPDLLKAVLQNEERTGPIALLVEQAHDKRLAKKYLPTQKIERRPTIDALSPREQEVLGLVAQGLRNQDIAERLYISEVTVKVHVRNIMRKLGARSRTHAVSLAAEKD